MAKWFLYILVILFLVGLPATVLATTPGDSNGDGRISPADIVYLINYLFKKGPPPSDPEAGNVNGDCKTSVSDLIYLINYLFKRGPVPISVVCGWSDWIDPGRNINEYGAQGPYLTPDGNRFFFATQRPGGYGSLDIWVTDWTDSGWSQPENLGPNINTPEWDDAPYLSPDGSKLYFGSWNRPGGYGSMDIWVSTWDTINHEWGIPENLGPKINTPGFDFSPALSYDGKKLYFQSTFILVSEWNDSGWGVPEVLDSNVNAGWPIGDPSITADGLKLYFYIYGPRPEYDGPILHVSRWNGTNWTPAEPLGPPVTTDSSRANSPHITPDDSKLFFTGVRGESELPRIWYVEKIPLVTNQQKKP